MASCSAASSNESNPSPESTSTSTPNSNNHSTHYNLNIINNNNTSNNSSSNDSTTNPTSAPGGSNPRRRPAIFTESQRLRKREIDRQSQRRIRDRRNTALHKAERAVELLRVKVEELSGELEQARAEIGELRRQCVSQQCRGLPCDAGGGDGRMNLTWRDGGGEDCSMLRACAAALSSSSSAVSTLSAATTPAMASTPIGQHIMCPHPQPLPSISSLVPPPAPPPHPPDLHVYPHSPPSHPDSSSSSPPTSLLTPFPFHTCLPYYVTPASCLSDHILLTFLSSRVAPEASAMRPDMPDVWPLLGPNGTVRHHSMGQDAGNNAAGMGVDGQISSQQQQQSLSLSRTLTDIIFRYSAITALPEKVGKLFVMYKFYHWWLAVQEGNDQTAKRIYAQLPSWLKPIPIQFSVQHPMWMDLIPWPRVRAHVIDNQALYPFEDFTTFYTPNFHVSWPYGAETTVMSSVVVGEDGHGHGHGEEEGAQHPSGRGWNKKGKDFTRRNRVVINPAFEHHVRKLESWDVKEPFRKRFPLIAALIDEG